MRSLLKFLRDRLVMMLMLLVGNVLGHLPCLGQQIAIPRIDAMPNKPVPYAMRNWKQVALGYDSLVTAFSASGRYLPLVWTNPNTVNYPSVPTFVMPSYVGAPPTSDGEAINCMPAVISGTLNGIDKSNQDGVNWVLMSREWFNNRPAEDVYLNDPVASSGSDWWYDLMPNVFFYQLYSFYPATTDYQRQLTTVADRWRTALNAMGASTTPWTLPNVNHTAWKLATMSPTDNGGGWIEPEAAGSIGWLLYNAYGQTGTDNYRIGAELAMEALLASSKNPSYELQLPYGATLAARMNAELGTTYDIAKIVGWCFSDGTDNFRDWGVMVGNWGGYDCDGLIGEINSTNDYPFFMNSVEQVGALVPLVRYDPRFARAIGKWVLNAANAARLFYTAYLPDDHQDSAAWAHQFDPGSYVAHEAMHQFNPADFAISPFATGDAIKGGWAATNYGLYGSSHAGILGAIIDTTNVPMILRLNVLATDYFHPSAFPTYLYFNPDSVTHAVQIDLGAGQHDVYDAVSKSFLLNDKSGVQLLDIPGNSAVLAVLTPTGGLQSYDLDKFLVSGRVVDYHSGHAVVNHPPRIKALAADSTILLRGAATHLYCTAMDQDGNPLTYSWGATAGTFSGSGATVTWIAPDSVDGWFVWCTVGDGTTQTRSGSLLMQVVQSIDHPPVITGMRAVPRKIDLGATSTISCYATDQDNDSLAYSWSAVAGVTSGSGRSVQWTAPVTAGNYYVRCSVSDGRGGLATDSIGLEVRDFSIVQTGDLVAYYPFTGNANDSSGFHHNGIVSGATPVPDRFGHLNSAYAFNGLTDNIRIPNDSILNFQNAITVNFWMNVGLFFPSREQYPISHGNWQNRWKASITPGSNTLRWTVKTSNGTKDLDSETRLQVDSLYNVTLLYSGSDFEIYLNGQLDAFTSWSGAIAKTTIDLTIAQDLPSEQAYNFFGTLDDIRIYNYALSVPAIAALYDINTEVHQVDAAVHPRDYLLQSNFPNPFNPSTTIRFGVPAGPGSHFVRLRVYDLLGREVTTLVDGNLSPGYYDISWDAAGRASGVYFARLETSHGSFIRRMLLLK